MQQAMFPRTQVAGVSLSRMIIGTNWMLGYSHTSSAADAHINAMHANKKATAQLIQTFMEQGVDTIMGPLTARKTLIDGMMLAQEATGRELVRIDTPVINVDDSARARREARKMIKGCAKGGAQFCLIHHSSAEQLVCKNTRTIDRLPDYLEMIREFGMIPGLSAHMPELIVYSDLNQYDVQTYIQIYNCMGFMMQVEIEYIHNVIWNAQKPVMTIKPMAAGRVSPFVGLSFAWATLREQDMVTVGCMTPNEAMEDIEISMAALEHRSPDLEGRSSPAKTSIMQK